MKRRAFTLWQLAGIVAFLALAAAVLTPVFTRPRGTHSRVSCLSNLKNIGLALSLYSSDYDGALLPVSSDSIGWIAIIRPYTTGHFRVKCPATKDSGSELTSDYFYNSRLLGLSYDYYNPTAKTNVPFPMWTIAAGDGLAGGSPNATLRSLPASWRNDPNSPAKRHMKMASYLFVDGHAKLIKANFIDDGERRVADDHASFAVR